MVCGCVCEREPTCFFSWRRPTSLFAHKSMSRFAKGKHVLTTALQEEAAPPGPGQAIVRALGSRGGNLVEVRREIEKAN